MNLIIENIKMALATLRSNKLRAFLTMLSVVVGILSIIGSMTAIGILTNSVSDQLSQLGNETFTVKKFPSIQVGGMDWLKYIHRKKITYDQIRFVREFTKLPLAVSAENTIAPLTVAYGNEKSDPQFNLLGSDDYFALNHNYSVSDGRMLTKEDVEYARDVCVLAKDIVTRIFKHGESPIGRTVKLNDRPYEVIGVFEAKGSGGSASLDNFALIPITNLLKYHADRDLASLTMTVRAPTAEQIEATEDEVIGSMRAARGVKPGADNDFEVESNTSLNLQFESFSDYIVYAGAGISAIALLAASIGIMNIMLVSVTERTKEIGIRKALGARRSSITAQFLTESVVICLIGGLFGIVLGIGFGNILAIFSHAPLYIPYLWVGIGLLVCTFVGIIFGMYPALKAARMDPIDALRFE
ncbi:MAG TPA: ABC transporter permease [Candidatus Kapabacteria bacterium]|nr:ABC transporter permease [Candidatus Kapabacteria bacterium]